MSAALFLLSTEVQILRCGVALLDSWFSLFRDCVISHFQGSKGPGREIIKFSAKLNLRRFVLGKLNLLVNFQNFKTESSELAGICGYINY